MNKVDVRDALFDAITDLAKEDKGIILMTADMGAWGLTKFRQHLPEQFINVGIAEQNLVSVAAGLALAGKKPFIYSIAAFVTGRCYDQIKVDLCQMNLPVTIIGSGPGLLYGSEGPTHHTTSDVVIMSVLPNMTIYTVRTADEAVQAVAIAYASKSPVYIRIAKDGLMKTYGQYKDPYHDMPFEVKSGI